MSDQDQDRAYGRLRAHDDYDRRSCAGTADLLYGPDGEKQKDRLARERAAKAMCASCPIQQACRDYAVGDGETIRERWGVWGGTTACERRRLLKQHLQADTTAPVPLALLRTRQKQQVLAALALHENIAKVCAEAGLDERTVEWQISRLTTLLRLAPGQRDRTHILAAAAAAGVLPDVQAEPAPTATQAATPDPQPTPARCDIPEQLALDLGDAARPRLRIIVTAPRRSARPASATHLTLDLLEAAA